MPVWRPRRSPALVTTHGSGGPADGRLPRLDYLLTDREWNPTADVPGGPGWTAEVLKNGDDYKNTALDKFGVALERAAIDQAGPESRRLVEAIIFETNADEQAKGYANGENPNPDQAADGGRTTDLRATDFIKPELRDSMGTIMSAYIYDVNLNIADGHPVNDDRSIHVDREDLVRFLADVGKDEGAHKTIAAAEAVYATTSYHDVLSGGRNPDATLDQNIGGMEVISNNYGRVMGALDLGLTEAQIAAGAAEDEKYNKGVETQYKIAGPLVEGAVGAATSRIPGAGDVANAFIGDLMEDLEKGAKADNHGGAAFDVGNTLGDGRSASVAIAEAALYESGRIPVPEQLIVDGRLKPMKGGTALMSQSGMTTRKGRA